MTAQQFRNNADAFTKSYLETALWSSTDDNDQPMDRDYDIEDIDETALDLIVADCAKFQEEQGELLTGENCLRGDATTRGGHDFWLTRNGHGAGFWDGDWAEPAA